MKLRFVLMLIFASILLVLAYHTPRELFSQLMVLYTAAFIIFLWIVQNTNQDLEIRRYIFAGLLIRVLMLLALPTLSDDFYRFAWDGMLMKSGIDPFAFKPEYFAASDFANLPFKTFFSSVFSDLNSQQFYSVYPAFNQYVFWISAQFAPGNLTAMILIMKVIVLLAECASIYLIIRILKYFEWPLKSTLLYAINPFIIIELNANLHFEVFMITFMLAFFYFFTQKHYLLSAVFFTFAVNSKVLPLLFIPYILFKIGFKKSIYFLSSLVGLSLLLNLPFLSRDFLAHYTESMRLYFELFAFNGSLFYLLKAILSRAGWVDWIGYLSTFLSLLSTFFIVFVSWIHRNKGAAYFPLVFLMVWSVYYFTSTTVHPWYLTPLLAFSLFTHFRFAYLWSFLIISTYITYEIRPYQENYAIIVAEYSILGIFLIYEWLKSNQISQREDISMTI